MRQVILLLTFIFSVKAIPLLQSGSNIGPPFSQGFLNISSTLINLSSVESYFGSISKISEKISESHPLVSFLGGDTISGIATADGVESFKGIPFAEPPIDDLRFRHPKPYNKSLDGFQAHNFSKSCVNITPFGFFSLSRKNVDNSNPHFKKIVEKTIFKKYEMSEDCLKLNIYRPAGTMPFAKLPVMVWFHGGAFQFGSSNFYPGNKFIVDSIKMRQPIIFVTFNYRVGPWGFLGGKAVNEEGSSNAGLYDQRLALKWVSDHVTAFGGDNNKITLIGESAGAISIAHHMVSHEGDISYKGKYLFHAAILQSGGPWSFDSVTSSKPEILFQKFSRHCGCFSYSSKKTLKCLRTKTVEDLQNAQRLDHDLKNVFIADSSDSLFGWSPRFDENLITDNPAKLIQQSKFAKVPYIIGTQEDEGTALTFLFDLKSTTQVNSYMTKLFTNTSEEDIDKIIKMYPEKLTPSTRYGNINRYFRIWKQINELFPGYLRFSEMIGDFIFHVPRRILLENTPESTLKYSFQSKYLHKIMPILGTAHSSELFWQFHRDSYPAPVYRRYFISFANHFDPNINTGLLHWDQYTSKNKETLVINMRKPTMGRDEFDRDNNLNYLVNHPELIMV